MAIGVQGYRFMKRNGRVRAFLQQVDLDLQLVRIGPKIVALAQGNIAAFGFPEGGEKIEPASRPATDVDDVPAMT